MRGARIDSEGMAMKGKARFVLLALLLAAGSAAAYWRTAAPFTLGEEVAASAKPGDIYMYGATTCGYCKKAVRWFGWHDVPYRSCEIDRDATCRAEFYARKGIGTPLFVVRGRQMSGYDPQAIAHALR
jgi:glutaredoxin